MGANAKVVEQAYAAFSRGDIAAVLDLVADEVDWKSPGVVPQGGEYLTRDAVGKFFEAIGSAWEALAIDVDTVTEIPGGRVVGLLHAAGTLRGKGPREYGATHIFTLQKGKIVGWKEYVDLDAPIG